MSGGTRPPRPTRAERAAYRRLSRAAGIPPATCGDVRVEVDVPVAAEDGTPLLTDHWWAPGAGAGTLLVRTPYGRRGYAALARFAAERGHHVIVQSCRGTFGSGGAFVPLADEAADGRATLRWVRAQPWAGPVHTYGFSYAGVTQWAQCGPDDRPDAMTIGLSARHFDTAIVHPGGGFGMDTLLTWCSALAAQERPLPDRLWRLARLGPGVARASFTRPPRLAAQRATGEPVAFFEEWYEHDVVGDAYWQARRFGDGEVPPVTLIAGWRDLFLDGVLADHAALTARGVPARLLVGDWAHLDAAPGVVAAREALRRLAEAVGEAVGGAPAGAPVRVEGSGGMPALDLAAWPPPARRATWALGGDGSLGEGGADLPAAALHYRYDPADPTPAAGGRTLDPFTVGRRDQRRRERRDDLLLFTSEPLPADLDVVGVPEVELTFASTAPRPDLFVRLCEVDARGRSTGITDGYRRLPTPTGERARVRLPLSAIAHRFAAGHRLRVQVSSAAHPLHLRHPGTLDPAAHALVPSTQEVLVGGATPAALHLPVFGATLDAAGDLVLDPAAVADMTDVEAS